MGELMNEVIIKSIRKQKGLTKGSVFRYRIEDFLQRF